MVQSFTADNTTPGLLPTNSETTFEITGTDFTGPIKYKQYKKREGKAYLAIFMFSLPRVMHLELMSTWQATSLLVSNVSSLDTADHVLFPKTMGKVYQDREMAMSVAGRWAPSWFPGSLQYHVEIHSKPSSLVGRPIWMVDWSHQNCPVQSHLGSCTDLDWTKRCAAGHGDPNQSMSIKLHRRWHKATNTYTINISLAARLQGQSLEKLAERILNSFEGAAQPYSQSDQILTKRKRCAVIVKTESKNRGNCRTSEAGK